MFIRRPRRFFDNFSGPGDLHSDLQTFLQCSLSGCRGPTRFNAPGSCATEVVGHAFIGRQHLYSRVPTWLTGIREPASERHRRESIESASAYLGRSVFLASHDPAKKRPLPPRKRPLQRSVGIRSIDLVSVLCRIGVELVAAESHGLAVMLGGDAGLDWLSRYRAGIIDWSCKGQAHGCDRNRGYG